MKEKLDFDLTLASKKWSLRDAAFSPSWPAYDYFNVKT